MGRPDIRYPTTMSLSARMEEQRRICSTRGCDFVPVTGDDKVGLALSTVGTEPINGLRHPVVGDTTGWYIWCGDRLSDSAEFFQPTCVDHLIEKLPGVTDFLALPLDIDSFPLTSTLISGSTRACCWSDTPSAILARKR